MSHQRPPSNPWVDLWKTTVSGVVTIFAITACAGVVLTGIAFTQGGARIDYNGLVLTIPAPSAPAATAPALSEPPSPPEPVTLVSRPILPWLGVTYAEQSRFFFGLGGGPAVSGAEVLHVQPGSPAEKAGLRKGDIIVSAEGRRMVEWGELGRVVQGSEVGQTITLQVYRDDGILLLHPRLEAILAPIP